MKKKKVILAYSGGLDTSVIVKWLDKKNFEVICFVADVGQREDFEALSQKATLSGAKKCIISDLREEFIQDFIYPALGFNALYEGRYMLGTSLARPIMAKKMVEIAKGEKTNYIAHGATGKGNDQVRFELTAYALYPEVKIIAPWRDPEFNELIPGRKEAIAYAKEHGIPVKATIKKPWSSDENLFHISFEAGILEDPNNKPQKDMFEYSVDVLDAPNKVTQITLEFEKGIPIKLNDQNLSSIALMQKLNKIGGENGVGRVDIVESRFVGMKSRGVYETPGGTILYIAHRDLEGLCSDRGMLNLKESLMPRFASLVYEGYWYSREMDCLLALLLESQKFVTGKVHLEIYKGNVIVVGRSSTTSLYDADVSSMDNDNGVYDQSDATGFINLHALPLKAHAKRINKIKFN